MTRFFMHIWDGREFIEDPDGVILTDLNCARQDALESARHLIAESVKAGEKIGFRYFEIMDEVGNVCATVPFRAALRLA